MVVEVTLVRLAIAGLSSGKSWWFHPDVQSGVARSEPAATRNEALFRRRRLEFLLAIGFGWIPGLAVESVVGYGDTRVNATLLAVSIAALVVYLFRSLRRYDRDGRERYRAESVTQEQERLDSAP